ncbi:ATP-binding protein [Streptomyces sp. ISL-98]|uniref:ATP-binding protein n=1 Tax=Streptomyces sp. ISL-98 TaxID=2819192 RepID=UPI001BE65839|nr:ATP-binding protein [Streptomyces sp. ISL-98]MBT2505128.1 ATP-binding protein [Streptomyces sp. ISL-98]
MREPQTVGSLGPSAFANLMAGIAHRPQIQPGPVDDAPNPDEPGHPEYHRNRRADWALKRWATTTPPRYRRADATLPDVQQWADRAAADPETAGSLLLTGTTGTGKTHEAYGALRRIAAAGPHVYEIVATTAADMYGLLRPKGSDRGTEEELRRLCRVPLLLLDDLGSAKASEWTEEVTYRLINERYNACRPSIYTSNLPADSRDEHGHRQGPDLTTVLGERIVSRLSEDTHVIAMTGRDRRRGAAA